jgi:hypothetical protein
LRRGSSGRVRHRGQHEGAAWSSSSSAAPDWTSAEDGGGVRADPGPGRAGSASSTPARLRPHQGPVGLAGLAGQPAGEGGGRGVDRRLVEGGVLPAGDHHGLLGTAGCRRPPPAQRPWPQDRRGGCGLDLPAGRARAGPPQLRATPPIRQLRNLTRYPKDRHPGTHPRGPAAGAGCWRTPAPELSWVASDILGVLRPGGAAGPGRRRARPQLLAEPARAARAPSSPTSKRPWPAASPPPWAAGGRDAHPASTPPAPPSAARAPRSAASPPPHRDLGAAADHPRGQPAHRRG